MQNAMALEEKYRVLQHGHVKFDTLPGLCYNVSKLN